MVVFFLENFGAFFAITLVEHLWRNLNKTIHNSLQPAITCSKLTIETVEQGVKYVQSYQ